MDIKIKGKDQYLSAFMLDILGVVHQIWNTAQAEQKTNGSSPAADGY
jgi:hypothetical protein